MASAPPHKAACLTAEIEGILRCLEANMVGDSRNGGKGGSYDDAEPGDEKPAALLHKALHDLQEKLKVQFEMQRRLVEEKESLQATAAKFQEEADQLRSQLRDMTTVGVSPFACLPEELALHVFSFLEMKEVCTARLVCSRWSVLGNDEGLLQVLVAKRCIPPAHPRKPVIVERDWKWLYLSQSRVLKLDAEKPPGGVGSARLASGARYDGEWKEGKEHGYGIKFWPIVVDTKPPGGEQDIAAASSLPNATAGDGGEGAGGDTSDADAGQGSSGEEGGGSRSAPQPSSSPQTKEPKTIVEYDSYEGMWKDGWEHGVGKYTWADGSEYKGDWVEGKRSGQGIYVWPNRSTYTGEWRDGHQEGWGIYRWPSGSLYMGMWKNGNQDGWGMKRWGDSSWYEGEWSDGQKHGKGTYSWIDGRRYKGQWKHGKKHGVGSYLWSDGTTYEGEWDLGLRHGRGVMRFIDGSVFDGLWWKDRRLKPGEDGSGTEREKLTYEKPYDHYFCEPDDFWEQKYRADIDARAAERRLEMEETKRRRKEIKKHCAEIQKRFQHY